MGRIKELKREAAWYGKEAIRRMGLDNAACAFFYSVENVALMADKAARYAGAALDLEATVYAPHQTILNNKLALQSRQMTRPRCSFQKHTVVTNDETGEQSTRIGAECGGKIHLKKRAGRVVGFECAQCGRYTSVEGTHEAVGELAPGEVVSGESAGAADEGVVSAEGGVAA
jgi:hypothetical protein